MVFHPPPGVLSPTVVESLQTWAPSLIAAALACTLLNAAGVVALAFLSLPLRLRKRLERTDALVDELVVLVDKLRKESALWESTVNGLVEDAHDAFARVEKKRASAAATQSRHAAAQVQQVPTTRGEIVAELRRRSAAAGG